MRNLKKILALVLALAMSMSLVTIANAADFSDQSDISYEEAVDVMTAIGVLEGFEDGSFKPGETLTREQAAKIICTMLLGENADKLGTTSSSFKDVAATRWSAPYIEYCASLGIIAGNGDGTYNPTGKLTGYAFAKMLLTALGYDAEIEGFVGAGWNLKVAAMASRAGILSDISDFIGTSAVTREQAAQMALSTLKAIKVEYVGNSVSVSGPDIDVTVGNNKFSYVPNMTNTDGNLNAAGTGDTYMQFAEQHFPTLKLTSTSADDDFGRPANSWSLKNVTIGTYGVKADKVYTAAADGSTADAKVKNMGLKGYTLKNGSITTVVNGKPGTVVTSLADIAALTGNGTVVEVFFSDDTADQITDVVVIYTELAQVASVTSTKVNLTTKTATVTGALTIDDEGNCFAAVSGLKKDDYVLVVPVYDDVTAKYEAASISIPETVSGNITAVAKNSDGTTNKSVTIGGVAYNAAANATTDVTTATVNTTVESTLWLDSYGYAIYAKATAQATKNFLYVLDAYQTLKEGKIVSMAKGILTDGTEVDVETASLAEDCKLYPVTNTDNDVYTLGSAITASTDTATGSDLAEAKKVVKLKANASIKSSDQALTAAIQDDTNYFTNYYAKDVAFIFVNTSTKTATVKTGVQSVSSLPTTAYAVVEANSSTDATPVVKMVILVDGIAATVDNTTLLYFNSNTSTGTVALENKVTGKYDTVPTYDAYMNGEKISVATSSTVASAGGYYTYAVSDSNGSYVLSAYNTTTGTDGTVVKVNKAVTSTFDGRLLTIDGVTVNASDAVIVDIRSAANQAAKPVVTTAAGLCDAKSMYKDLNLSVIYDGKTGVASHIYIVSVGSGYTITAATITSVEGYSVSTDKTTANGGDTVTVTVSATAAAATKTITFAAANAASVGTPTSYTHTTGSAATYTFTFVVGTENVAPTVTLA